MRTLLVFIAATLIAAPLMAGHGGMLPFDADYARKEAEAKMFGKPIAYYFTASW